MPGTLPPVYPGSGRPKRQSGKKLPGRFGRTLSQLTGHSGRVPSELEFGTDLYRGTAPYYDRYRPAYPDVLFEDLLARTRASGDGRLLDLACGTGQIALPLARRFASVVAVDQEPETVEFARSKSPGLGGASSVRWVSGSVETVELEGRFDLITVGNAFQRFRRHTAAARMRSWLVAGGAVALLWSDMPWVGDLPWQRELFDVFVEWTDRAAATDRVPAGFEQSMSGEPHEQVLRRAGFDYAGKFEFSSEQVWTVETLVGFMYSTSLLNRAVLGQQSSEFEADLQTRMTDVEPTGRFVQALSSAYELAVASS